MSIAPTPTRGVAVVASVDLDDLRRLAAHATNAVVASIQP